LAETYHPRFDAASGTFAESAQSTDGVDAGAVATADAASTTPVDATTTTETPPVDTQVAAPPAQEDTGYFISRKQAYQDLLRYAKEDPEFDRTIKSYAGRGVKRDLERQLREANERAEALQRRVFEREVAALSDEERGQLVARDPDFARAYADIMSAPEPEPGLAETISYYNEQAETLYEKARRTGVSEARLLEFDEAAHVCTECRAKGAEANVWQSHTWFDHDRSKGGQLFEDLYSSPQVARQAKFDYFKAVLDVDIKRAEQAAAQRALEVVSAPPPPQAPPPAAAATAPSAPAQAAPPPPVATAPASNGAGTPNPNLSRMAPDLGMGSRPTSPPSGFRYTADEIRSMPTPDRIKLMEQHGGREKMITDGVLYVAGLSEDLGFNR
jgi:hypothetical protein